MTNIPEYIQAVTDKKYDRSYQINQIWNVFPGSLGRICTRPCEDVCRHGYEGYGDPVSICRLKRVGSDFRKTSFSTFRKLKKTGKPIVVVGAGPAGLAATRDLLLLGHDVTLIESSHQLGGMMPLAIPQFRLPREVIQKDIDPILALKPKVKLNTSLGKDVSLNELLQTYDAVLLAIGCQRPYTLGVPGEDLENVHSGLEFLVQTIRGNRPKVGQKTLVVGGGYTAVDCARTLVRMGSTHVTLVYRRTPKEISIDAEEMRHLAAEDVTMRFLTTVTGFAPDASGLKVQLIRTKLVDNKVQLIRPSQKEAYFDTAIICVGQGAKSADFIPKNKASHFRNERLLVNRETFQSDVRGLFGTGDYVMGTRSIIDAIAEGRKAAQSIHAYLSRSQIPEPKVLFTPASKPDRSRSDDFISRVEERNTIGKKTPKMTTEVACGLNAKEGFTESRRCYLCNLHYEIDLDNCIFCMRCIEEAPVSCIKTVQQLGDFQDGKRVYVESNVWNEISIIYIDNDKCVRCNKCLEVCPTRCISVSKVYLKDPIYGGKG